MNKNDYDKIVSKRYEDNVALLTLLVELIGKSGQLRFNQILINYGFVTDDPSEFYTEPSEVLKRVKEQLEKLNESKP